MLGALRNKYVHQLDYQATEQDQADLINTLKSSIGLAAQYYLRRHTEFPNGLRRCVFALWLPLEMYCTPEEEVPAMVQEMIKLLASESGMTSEEFNKYRVEMLERSLSANISETLTLPEFSVEGGEGIDDGNDGCYAIIHLGGGSDGQANTASI